MTVFRSCITLSYATLAIMTSGLAAVGQQAAIANPIPHTTQQDTAVIELPLYSSMPNREFIQEARRLAIAEIQRQFNQSPSTETLRVAVLGSRNGTVIPILQTTVSRQQWTETPQLDRWTHYNDSSYAMLHQDGSNTPRAPRAPRGVRQSPHTRVAFRDPMIQVEQAYASGRISQREFDTLVDALD